jgi:hypothetical protein
LNLTRDILVSKIAFQKCNLYYYTEEPAKLGSQLVVTVQSPPPTPPTAPPGVPVADSATAAERLASIPGTDAGAGAGVGAAAAAAAAAAAGAVAAAASKLIPWGSPAAATATAAAPEDDGVIRAWLASACGDDEKAQMMAKSKIQIIGVPPTTNNSVNATAIAAVTILMPYDVFHFELWKRYYGEAVGSDNLYVILHYHPEDPEALARLNLTGVTVAGLFCAYDTGRVTTMQRDATHTLLRMGYTAVVNGHVDEFLVVNKEKYPGGISEFAQKDPGFLERDYVRGHGVSVVQTEEESGYNPAQTLFAQR